MQESTAQVTSTDDTQCAPQHDAIAQCARDLWIQYGQPADRDLAIWLEAEQQLDSVSRASRRCSPDPVPSTAAPLAKPTVASSRKKMRR
jgi:hypothetical protein